MADTRISELSGISQGAVVALSRISVSTVEQLLKADFHEVAYALDSYDDAEALIRTAMKRAKSTADAPAPAPTRSKSSKKATTMAKKPERNEHMDLVGAALAAVWDDLCTGRKCAEAFDELIRRIEQARLVAELDQDGAATAAALACDETGSPIDGTPEEIAELIAGAEQLLVVSMTPGAGRKAHAARVEEANETVRLLVTARALTGLRQILATLDKKGADAWATMDAGREGTLWYYRTISESLAATDETPLVGQASQLIVGHGSPQEV